MVSPGTWSIGGYQLPDFGITEKLGITPTQSAPAASGGGGAWTTPTSAPNFTQVGSNSAAALQGNVQPTFQSQAPSYATPSGNQPQPSGDPTQNQQQSGPSEQEIFQKYLDDSYNNAFGDISRQEDVLGQTKASQEQQVGNLYNTSNSRLNSEKGLALSTIENQQSKSLTDLATAIRQQFQAGNTMLGARGASDSSAANQYSYALTKMGSKQQGDLMSNYSQRRGQIESIYANNIKDLETSKINQLMQIKDWFNQATSQLSSQRSALSGQKSQAILDFALQQIQTVKAQEQSRKDALSQWALNRSTTLNQAAQALGIPSQNLPAFQSLNQSLGTTTPTTNSMFGYSNTNDQQQTLFGN